MILTNILVRVSQPTCSRGYTLTAYGCLIAGHSLGGALATLAAYDIRQELAKQQQQQVEVVCYSFGAPRTGNHAFARDYNHMVPDTWSIINDQVEIPCCISCTTLLKQHVRQHIKQHNQTARLLEFFDVLCCSEQQKDDVMARYGSEATLLQEPDAALDGVYMVLPVSKRRLCSLPTGHLHQHAIQEICMQITCVQPRLCGWLL